MFNYLCYLLPFPSVVLDSFSSALFFFLFSSSWIFCWSKMKLIFASAASFFLRSSSLSFSNWRFHRSIIFLRSGLVLSARSPESFEVLDNDLFLFFFLFLFLFLFFFENIVVFLLFILWMLIIHLIKQRMLKTL